MPQTKNDELDLTCGQRWLVHRFITQPFLARPIQRTYLLNKDFNYHAFYEAIQHIVASHPSLRLRLIEHDGKWKQYFPEQVAKVSLIKVRGITRLVRIIYSNLLIAEELKSTLDLRKEPPVNAKVLKVNGEHLLVLRIDHIAADGISFNLFEKELLSCYEKATNAFPLIQPQTNGFIKYLENEIARKDIERENLLYWKQHFKNFIPIEISNSNKDWVIASQLSFELTDDQNHFFFNTCQLHKCSVLCILVACQLLLLSDSRKLNDIVVSIPISNRLTAEEQSIIANLFMPVHIRFTFIDNEPISQFLLRVRDLILNAVAHRQYDYTSLSQFISTEARKHNGRISFTRGCSLIVDRNPLIFPNSLFKARLDNRAGQRNKISKEAFYVTAQQTTSKLSITMEWDGNSWQIENSEMKVKFLKILESMHKIN